MKKFFVMFFVICTSVSLWGQEFRFWSRVDFFETAEDYLSLNCAFKLNQMATFTIDLTKKEITIKGEYCKTICKINSIKKLNSSDGLVILFYCDNNRFVGVASDMATYTIPAEKEGEQDNLQLVATFPKGSSESFFDKLLKAVE